MSSLFNASVAYASNDQFEEALTVAERIVRIYSGYPNIQAWILHLRRIPGVQVTGAGDNVNVQIRGTSSFTSETRPLYVVDGQIRGNSYYDYDVNRSIIMSEVASTRVLKDSDAASFGARGANGMIIIDLKR